MPDIPNISDIPQIKPVDPIPDLPASENSILVPKINPQQEVAPTTPANPQRVGKSFGKGKVVLIIVIAVAISFVLLALPFINVYSKTKAFMATAKGLSAAAQTQNITSIKGEIGKTKTSLADLSNSYKLILWAKFVPFIGPYVSDGEHALKGMDYGLSASEIAISAGEPYLDILGFGKSDKAQDGTKTTQERLDFIIKAIPSLTPKVGEIAGKIGLAKTEIDQINPERYPVRFQGKEIRPTMVKYFGLFGEAATLIENSKPLLEISPYLLGVDSPRTYLVLFQNDKELRPTGGFMTAYSIMKVDKGKFQPVNSSDIYNLDAQYKPKLPAPDPIVKYIKGPYILSKNLRLRDMNWSPDFAVSMNQFSTEAQGVGIKGIDGIIAVDTQLLVNLLNAIGPIGVPGFGNFSTQNDPKCNCPQVIYELESFADVEGPIVWDPNTGKIVYRPPNSDNRKKIIGPLMNSILANAMGQPKDKLPALFEAGFKSLTEKHVLFYLNDSKAQAAVTAFGIAGKIEDTNGDYLHVNDSNLGGRKSNLYVTQEVEQTVKVLGDGSVEKTIVITYKNPAKEDGWLNSILPNWVRVYVPKGSQLLAVEGLDDKQDPYEDLGKTVFAGFFKLRPEGVSKITLKYKLPFKVKGGNYNLLIQKQPGTDKPLYTVKVGRESDEFFLTTDKELKFKI